MKRAILISALAALAAGCISIDVEEAKVESAAAAAAASSYDGATLKRGALIVSSMERSMAIYRDILGFQANGVTQSKPNSYSYEVFNLPRDKPIRFATLNAGPDQPRALALIESPGIQHRKDGPRPVALVINANGRLDEMLAKLAGMGLTIIPERPLVSDTQGTGRETAFIDPDGHLIVLYQFPKSDPPNRL
jgi:catechol 2,3-dioxygenase-like lactoylglutathione lyase family enzyme